MSLRPTTRVARANGAHLRSRDSTFTAPQELAPDAALDAGVGRESRHLLRLAMPAELLAYRHRYLQQAIAQTAGPARPGPPLE